MVNPLDHIITSYVNQMCICSTVAAIVVYSARCKWDTETLPLNFLRLKSLISVCMAQNAKMEICK